jgi:hypothetical protein
MNAPLVLNHKCLGVSSVIALEEQESEGIHSVPGNYPIEFMAPSIPSHALTSYPAMRLFVGRLQGDKVIYLRIEQLYLKWQ